LSKALATKRTFAYQQEAEQLLAQLAGEEPMTEPATAVAGPPKEP
jgi:hypothetical protein